MSYTYQSFLGLMAKMGEPAPPVSDLDKKLEPIDVDKELYTPPSLADLDSVDTSQLGPHLYPGGETEALLR